MELCYIKIFRIARYWERYLFVLNKTIYFIFKGGSSHKFAVLFYYLFNFKLMEIFFILQRVSSLILLCVHVMACWWIEVGTMPEYGETSDLPDYYRQIGWVTKYYQQHPNKPQYGEVNKDVYITGYYFVTTTIATVGYGDISSKTVLENFFSMFCEFFGIALFGYISGGLVSAVKVSLLLGTLKKNQQKSEFDQWLYQREKNQQEPLFSFLLKNLRAINHFNSENNFSDFFNKTQYFHYLPKEQKRRVFNLIFTDIATFFGAFFRNISELSMIQDIFQYMHPLTFLPGGEIIRYRNQSRGIYFIVQGKVYIKNEKSKRKTKQEHSNNSSFFQKFVLPKTKNKYQDKQHFRKLQAGSFFGEFCLLEKNSAFSFIAGGKQPLNTLFITKKKLQDICQKYQETFSWLKKFTYYRFKYFNMEKLNFKKKMNIYSQDYKNRRASQQKNKKTKFIKTKSIFSRNNKIETPQFKDEMQQNLDNQSQHSEILYESQNISSINQDYVDQNNNNQVNNQDNQYNYYQQNNDHFQNQYDFINDEFQIIQEHNLEEDDLDESINGVEKNNLSIQKDNIIEQTAILEQNQNNFIQNDVQKQDLLQIIERNEQVNLRPSLQNLNNNKKKNISDLEFFLQNGTDDFKTEKLKKHIRQQSCQPEFQKKDKSLHLKKQIQQNDKKINTENNKIYNQRSKTESNPLYNQEMSKNFENKNNKAKDKILLEKFQHQRHHKHLSLNNENEKQNQKNDSKKTSSNFQSLQLSEFSEFGQSNQQFNQFYKNTGQNGSQININQPYQFDCHSRGFNPNVLSPISKENDRLICTPFSSNQQTHTKDTINNQRLLFSDDDQNSIKNNFENNKNQSRKNNLKIQKNDLQHNNEESDNSDKQYSCVIDMDDTNNQVDDNRQKIPFQFDFNLKNNQKNQICFNSNHQGILNQNQQSGFNSNLQDYQINKINFNQFIKQQTDQQSQQDLFVSILEQGESQQQQNDSSQSQINQEHQLQKLDQQINLIEDISNQNNIPDKSLNKQINYTNNEFGIKQQQLLIQQAFQYQTVETSSEKKSENQPITDLIKFDSDDFLSFLDDELDSQLNQNNKKINQQNVNENNKKQYNDEVIEDIKSNQLLQINLEADNQNEQQALSKSTIGDEMNSDEEKELESKVTSKQLSVQRNESVQQIILINEEEKKIRRAFRYLTNSNNKIEMRHTKKQQQIAEQIGVKIPFVHQISQSRYKKQAQHKVMRKILNKKIQILVQTVLEKHNSEKMYSTIKQSSNRQLQNLHYQSFNQNNKSQFEQLMKTTSQSNSQSNTSKSQKEQKNITFNQAVSQRSSSSNNNNGQIQDLKQCVSVYQNNSPSNKNNLLTINSQKNSSHVLQIQDATLPKNISLLPKSKFSTSNDNRSPKQKPLFNITQNNNTLKDSSPNFFQSALNQKQMENEDQNDKPQDIINEDENESLDDISDEQDTLNESQDNIELQIDKIQSSRIPNFQLMLYIEKMISQHKKEYLYSTELLLQDDYQCYEEIESGEKGKLNLIKQQQGLDNSFDIPIDIIKPNFEIGELFNLPCYLDNQISILENKIDQIVENTYEECNSCLEKIKKLAKIKEKRYLFMGTKEDTDTFINQDNLSHIQTRDHVNTVNQQKITISNMNVSQPLNKNRFHQQSIQVENGVSNINININNNSQQVFNSQSVEPVEDNTGRVNLGHNIQFALNNEQNSPQKDEYNFFTELERKNQILLQQNSSIILEGENEYQTLPNIKSLSNIQMSKKQQSYNLNEEQQKEQINTRRMSEAVFRMKIPSKDFGHLAKSRKSKFAIKACSKEFLGPTISEQQKIKNEFQRMFMNMRSNTNNSPTNVNNILDYSSQNYY